jgi:hypothetical protein
MKRASSDQVLLQVTLSADESPELFQALMQIRDPKRRVGRFRDLATRGLLVTPGAFAPALVPRASALAAGAGGETSPAPSQSVVDGLTDWTNS